jgi:hypothetical protein
MAILALCKIACLCLCNNDECPRLIYSAFWQDPVQKKPGLSSYASNPDEAVDSLRSLLEDAINVVPKEKRSETPVRLGVNSRAKMHFNSLCFHCSLNN